MYSKKKKKNLQTFYVTHLEILINGQPSLITCAILFSRHHRIASGISFTN